MLRGSSHARSGVEMGEARTGKWKDLVYKGSSPDEEAFVAFTKANGFVFSSRVRDELQVTVEIDPDHPVRFFVDCLRFLVSDCRNLSHNRTCTHSPSCTRWSTALRAR